MQASRSVVGIGISSGLMGAAAAVATIFAWSLLERPGAPEAPAKENVRTDGDERSNTRIVVRGADETRLAELERQVQALKAERETEPSRRPKDEEAAHDPEETRRALKMRLSALDRRHHEEAADPEWAPGAERSLFSALTAMGDEYGFSVDAAECKTTMCRASLSWPDYNAARKTGAELAERSFPDLNCNQTVSYLRPDDRAVPYSTQLYFDCTDLRARSVEAESSSNE